MIPVKVITKAIVVLTSETDRSRGLVATYVDGKIHATYPHRSIEEAHQLAERLARNEADLELARIKHRYQVIPADPPMCPVESVL